MTKQQLTVSLIIPLMILLLSSCDSLKRSNTLYEHKVKCDDKSVFNKTQATIYDTNRTWKAIDFGIYPDKDTCYTKIIQDLIDIAYTLPGKTIIKFPAGTYRFNIYFDCTKLRYEPWVSFQMSEYGSITFYGCENK